MKAFVRYRTRWTGLGAAIIAVMLWDAAQGAQPNDTRRSPPDNQWQRGPSQETPPPNRQIERQAPPPDRQVERQAPPPNRQIERQAPPDRQVEREPPPQFRRSPDSPSGAETGREPPIRRGDDGAGSGRTARRDDSPSTAGNHETPRSAEQPSAGGRRQIDAAGEPNDSGGKAGSNRPPTAGEAPRNDGDRPQANRSRDAKSQDHYSSGGSRAIDEVRRWLGGSKRAKNSQPSPDRLALADAASRSNTQPGAFQQRLQAGDFNRLIAGKTATKLQLGRQYGMYPTGDVARRMNLPTHGARAVAYRGLVSPSYQHHSMKYCYAGPALFAKTCLYPLWGSWVEWSWYHRCRPYWDPRPFCCRPILYRPCPAWVYWETPAWTPLPAVACGTWVDVPPVEFVPDCDLQLLAVRFVDPGHPQERLGPRYRVWFRNNGSLPVTRPFSVMLLAANDRRLTDNLPQAGVQVAGIDAGDVQSVDIRLPAEVYAMRHDAHGNPLPFSVLHVLVNADRAVAETDYRNNGAILNPATILPVDPATFELEPTAATPGQEVLLAGEGLGPQPGRVLLQINGREMDGEILGWYDLGVRWTVPQLNLAAPVEADVVVIRGDGAAANPVKLTLNP